MTLGIGRGDSSLAHIGSQPARLGVLRSFLVDLPAYLRGETVDMAHHASCLAPHARNLPDDFLDRFAVLGDAEQVAKRLEMILQQPIDRLALVAASPGAAPGLVERNLARLSQEILPRLTRR